ncbi:hypothetical protein C8J57DRAFT_985881, partial [Mycena rebaudengoi]
LLLVTDSVISGSVGLLALFVSIHQPLLFIPNDLDIYTTRHEVAHIVRFLFIHAGYYIDTSHGADYFRGRHVWRVLRLRRISSPTTIKIIVSASAYAVMPIPRFDFTFLMNWIDAHGVFCAYPDATFNYKGVINTSVVHVEHPVHMCGLYERLTKYARRGFSI